MGGQPFSEAVSARRVQVQVTGLWSVSLQDAGGRRDELKGGTPTSAGDVFVYDLMDELDALERENHLKERTETGTEVVLHCPLEDRLGMALSQLPNSGPGDSLEPELDASAIQQ
ncbi:hypothetical protein AOLI_G00117190 [Acnodon oligacanthus]